MLALDDKSINIIILIFVLVIAGISRLIKYAVEKAQEAKQKAKQPYHERLAEKPAPIPRLKGYGQTPSQRLDTQSGMANQPGVSRPSGSRFTPPPPPLPQEQAQPRPTPQFQMPWDLEELYERDTEREAELLHMKQQLHKLRQKLQQVQTAKPVAVPPADAAARVRVAPPSQRMPSIEATQEGPLEYEDIALDFSNIQKMRQAIIAMEILMPPVSMRQID